jgi:hypothetical protein
MTFIQNLQVPFNKRYEYKIITRDLSKLENISKQIVLEFIFPDNSFNTFKYNDIDKEYDMCGTHSKDKIYDDVKYKDNHGPGNNYSYSIRLDNTFDNFADLYEYVCEENFVSIKGYFLNQKLRKKPLN